MDIPVYLFTGFLEAGKTKFIQETLADKRFNNGEKTLLILCEEGEEEYNPSAFTGKNVFIEIVEDESELTPKNLEELRRKYKAERVIVEYNGMWQLQSLFQNLPSKWIIAQEFMFADANTFVSFNTNMRSLVVDKLTTCEIVIFNRFTDAVDKMALHKIVRGINRKANIAYERVSGDVEFDNIEDPLPFDINAPIIEIGDLDYAIWYRDLSEELQKYDGKRVKFLGMVAKAESVPDGSFVIGRPVMTCCVDDIQFAGLACNYKGAAVLKNKQWVKIDAVLNLEKHKMYGKVGPVLNTISVSVTDAPEEPVATF